MTDAIHQPWPPHAWLLQINDLRVDTRYRRVIRPDQSVELPQRTFDLLLLFLREPHALHTRADLFQRVWPGVIVEDANLSQSIWVLRKALGPERKDWIRTVAKGGYVFEPPAPVLAVDERPIVPTPEAVDGMGMPAPARPPHSSDNTPSLPTGNDDAAAPVLVAPAPASTPAPPRSMGSAHPARRRGWILAVGLCLTTLVAAASWFGNIPVKPAPTATNVLLMEVRAQDPRATGQGWRTTLLHAWLDWKLRSLPEVNVLREENLATEASPAQHKVVLLATGTPPEEPDQVFVRASFDGLAGNESVQLKGPAADLPKLVDDVSQQVLRRLLPSRVDNAWPPLALDLEAARSYADAFTALERRDWASAQLAAQGVIQRAPGFAVARLQLATALGRLGQAGVAIEQFATARTTLRPLPKDAGKVIDAMQLATDPRRLPEATDAMGELAKAYPERRGFLLDQAKMLARAGQLDQARAILTREDWQTQAVGLRIPQLLALAELHLQLGDHEQARAHATSARKLATGAGPSWRIEHAMAVTIQAQADVSQYEGKADLTQFEQAAREFESAGDEIDALYARFLAASARPAGDPAVDVTLDALLQKARAGGYRRIEIDILRRAAFQQYIAGNMAEYRARLAQALTVANASGDATAQQYLDLDLLNEDMAVGDLASAEQRLQRLRASGLRGDRAFWVTQFDSALHYLRGQYDAALATLGHAPGRQRANRQDLPPIPKARTACSVGDVLLAQGHVAQARERYATCAKIDHALTRLLADLGMLALDAVRTPHGASPAALDAMRARINAMPDGPDRWWPIVALADLYTRAGHPEQAEAIYHLVAPGAARANYTLLTRIVELGLAEVAALRGDWDRSRTHAQTARAGLPADNWFLHRRLAELDIGHHLAQGNTETAQRQLAQLDAKAHALGDAIVLQEVHSLMPPATVVGKCNAASRNAFTQRTGLHGATLAWMAPRTDRVEGAIKVVSTRPAP